MKEKAHERRALSRQWAVNRAERFCLISSKLKDLKQNIYSNFEMTLEDH